MKQGEPEPDEPATPVPADPEPETAEAEDAEDAEDAEEEDDDEDDPGWDPALLPPPWVEVTSPAHGIPLPYSPPECDPHPESDPLAPSPAPWTAGLSGVPRWMVAATAGVAGLAILAVASLVAVRTYGSHRAEARLAAIRVEFPGQVLGLPRQPEFGGAATAGTSTVLSVWPPGTRAAVYSAGTGAAVVVVALPHRIPPSEPEGQANWRSFERSLGESVAGAVHLADRDPGELGGRFACGRSGELVLCLATDSAVTLGIIGTGSVPGGAEAVATVRRTVERLPD